LASASIIFAAAVNSCVLDCSNCVCNLLLILLEDLYQELIFQLSILAKGATAPNI
jgi:hypothetical protein